jgi:Flp pilus assembly protein TadG
MGRARQSGQALVELALALPILLLLALGVVEIGRYAYISILIGNAAHAGAVFGSQGTWSTDPATIQKAAQFDFAGGTTGGSKGNGLDVSSLTVTSTTSCGCDSAGTVTNAACDSTPSCAAGAHWVVVVTVTASGKFCSLFNYPGLPGNCPGGDPNAAGATALTINRTSSMRVL